MKDYSSYIERAIQATIQTFTETFSFRPDETALRSFLKMETKYLKAQEIDFKNKCETDQREAARREIQEYFNKCNDQMQRIELDINACTTNAKPQNMVNDYALYCLYSLFHKDLLNDAKTSPEASTTAKSEFSATDWAVIFYYADETKLLPEEKRKEKRIKDFISKHGVSQSFNNVKNQYYSSVERINDGRFPISQLCKVEPFIKIEYPLALTKLINDKNYIEENSPE